MPRGKVLVAIVNNLKDMRIAREEGWYRIPVASVRKWLKDRWPPRWLAFYQTKVMATINHLKGLDHTTGVPVRYNPDDPLGPQQLGLFDRGI